MTVGNEKEKFERFHELVINGMDYESAIKNIENLPNDYVLSEEDKELFDILFKTEALLNSIEKMPEESRPKKELELLFQKLKEAEEVFSFPENTNLTR